MSRHIIFLLLKYGLLLPVKSKVHSSGIHKCQLANELLISIQEGGAYYVFINVNLSESQNVEN